MIMKCLAWIFVLVCVSVSFVSASWCWQEDPVIINQGTYDNNGVFFSDGNCNLQYTGAVGSSGYYYLVNYTKPPNALPNSQWWLSVGYSPFTTLDMSSVIGCWNQNPLQFRVQSRQESNGNTWSGQWCWDGSSWIGAINAGGCCGNNLIQVNAFNNTHDGNWTSWAIFDEYRGYFLKNTPLYNPSGWRFGAFFEDAMNWSVANEWCMQNLPNESNAGCGSSTGFINVSNSLGAFIYFTYVKPSGVDSGSIWQVKHGINSSNNQPLLYNASIPSACWNANSTHLFLRAYANHNFVIVSDDSASSRIECYNGSSWMQFGFNSFVTGYIRNAYIDIHPEFMFDKNWNTFATFQTPNNFWDSLLNQSLGLIDYGYFYEQSMWWHTPVISPSIVPSSNVYANDSFKGYCSGFGVTNLSYDWYMYKNGVLNVSGIAGTGSRMCYQEDVTNGNQNDTQNCGLDYSGSKTYTSTLISGFLFMDYKKPLNSHSAVWQYKIGNLGVKNVSIPSSCWNAYDSYLHLGAFTRCQQIIGCYVDIVCYNGTGSNYNDPFPPNSDWVYLDGDGEGGNPCWTTSQSTQTQAWDNNWNTPVTYQQVTNYGWVESTYCVNTSSINANSAFYEEGIYWNVTNGFDPLSLVNVVNISGLSKGDSWTLRCKNLGYSALSTAVPVLNSPHIFRSISYSPFNISLFNQFVVQVNMTDVDNDVLFVNVSVEYPNGSVIVMPTSFVNGLYVTQNITAWNGTFRFNVSSDEGLASSTTLFIPDLWFVSPPDYVQISAGENFTFPITLNTNSTSNLSFTSTCIVDGIYFNCSLAENPIYIVGAGVENVTVTTSGSTPNGSYYGNLSIVRDFDNRTIVVPINLGIASSFGKPVLLNPQDWTSAVQTATTTSKTFVLYNNGSYPLSDCVGSFDNTLAGQGWISFTSNFTLNGFSAMNYSIIFTNPSAGLYQGKFSITCKATPTGILNSLEVPNRPSALVFVYPALATGGGGGGGGSPQVIVVTGAENQSLFTIETDSGATESVLYMYPKQVRNQVIIVRSQVYNDQQLTLSCSGAFCSNVQLSRSSFKIVGKSDEIVFLNITMPENAPYGAVYSFDVAVSDGLRHTGILKYELHVSRISSFFSKFNPLVNEGDAGFWFKVGNVNVPKLVLYLLELLGSVLMIYFVVPDPKKDKKYKDIKPLLYIIVSLGVVLVTVVVY